MDQVLNSTVARGENSKPSLLHMHLQHLRLRGPAEWGALGGSQEAPPPPLQPAGGSAGSPTARQQVVGPRGPRRTTPACPQVRQRVRGGACARPRALSGAERRKEVGGRRPSPYLFSGKREAERRGDANDSRLISGRVICGNQRDFDFLARKKDFVGSISGLVSGNSQLKPAIYQHPQSRRG